MDDAVPLRAAVQPRLSGRALRILTDEKLAAMVAAGSDDAFATLYGRHHQAVYRYCLSMLRQEADGRDALQSAMLAALSSLRARPIEGAFKPWLFRIAHNESISIIRGRAREAPTEAPATAAVTDDRETREQVRTLVADIGALPERQRGAIVMRELSGLGYAEIAAALSTSEAGGKQLVYQARSALQELRAGHEMSCEAVRERISAADRRLLRGRKVRAHLRGCQPCQDFEQGIRRRRQALAALAPPLAPLLAAGVLEDVFGGGAGGGLGGGGAAGATGVASAGAPLAGSAALKLAAATLLAGAAGVGVYEAATAILGDHAGSTAAALTEADGSAGQAGGQASRDGASHPGRAASGRGEADGARGAAANSQTGAGQPDPAAGGEDSQTGDVLAPGGADALGDPTGPGDSSGGPGAGGSTDPPPGPSPSPPPESPPGPGGGGSGVAPGTPPGHGGTPPGQGGTPPGQGGSDIPPGQIGNPGKGNGPP